MKLEQQQFPQLTCPIVRDLLPLYLEGLTSRQTNQAIEAHLANCPACAQYKETLASPIPPPPDQTEREKEPDYLKAIRRRSLRKAAAAALIAIVAVLTVIGLQTFWIGTPAQAEDLFWSVEQQKEDCLTVQAGTAASATAFRGWQVEYRGQQGDIAVISARKTLASSLFGGSGQMGMDIPLDGIRQVELCGAVIWQDGLTIPQETWLACQAATPYVGDAPALGRLAQALKISALCGEFTNSLQTEYAPYGWTLHFSQVPQDAALLDQQMERLAYQLLALVGNLEQVRWTYPQYGGQQVSRVLTLSQAEYRLSTYFRAEQDLKSYAQSPAALEQLRQTVSAGDFPINP